MFSKFGQSGLFTLELPALIAEKIIFDLLGMLDSGEPSLPFFIIFILDESIMIDTKGRLLISLTCALSFMNSVK